MKVLLAADGESLKSRVAKRFGHANYYLIYSIKSGELDVRENSGHVEDHSDLIDLVNEGISSFIVGNIGPNAFKVLVKTNSKVYLARGLDAQTALDKFLNNELEKLSKPTLKRSIRDH